MTAGILPAARILRAAPLPKLSRTSATTLLDSSAMSNSLPAGPAVRRAVLAVSGFVSTRTHRSDERRVREDREALTSRGDNGLHTVTARIPRRSLVDQSTGCSGAVTPAW